MAHKKSGGSGKKRPKQPRPAAGREGVRLRECDDWQHHRKAARHAYPPGANVRRAKDDTLFALLTER